MAAAKDAAEPCDIDFEVDSEWCKCIYTDFCRGKDTELVKWSRNNSSTDVGKYGAPHPGSRNNSSTASGTNMHAATYRRCSRNNSSADHSKYFAPTINPTLKRYNESMGKMDVDAGVRQNTLGIALSLCVRKYNYEDYLWQFVHNGLFSGSLAYENLYLWTMLLKVRMHRKVAFGSLMRGVQSRFGLKSSNCMKFCLDGFYGMSGCGDIFGNNGVDDVPWMEISQQSTADSLHLEDGDIIFVSFSNEKLEGLAQARKRRLTIDGLRPQHDQKLLESTNNYMHHVWGTADSPASNSALPSVGVAQMSELHRARRMLPARSYHLVANTQTGGPLCLAAETMPNSQFCLAVINPSDSEFDADCVDLSAVFTVDGLELMPGALSRLLSLQSELGDLFRVHFPGFNSGLGLAMSPELLTHLLDAAQSANPTVQFLLNQTKSRVFKFDTSSAGPMAEAASAGDVGIGVGAFEELQRFAAELDVRLKLHCSDQAEVWRVVSVDYFVVDTFFAAAVSSIYGTNREHRFQPYTVDCALLSIDECLTAADLEPGVPCEHHLTRAWDLLYSLHPTARDLSSELEPCAYLRRLKDAYLRTNAAWQSFVGYSVCALFDDYNAKKAAFWAINYLVSNRVVYDTLLSEIESAAGLKSAGRKSEVSQMTLKNIEDLQFLEAFVKEVYRHTSCQFLRFQTNTSMILQTQGMLGFKYRKGSQIAVLLRALNMSPEYFHKPGAFCPQRFLSASQDARLLCLPFGVMSPRRRLGLLKLKIFIVMLLCRSSLGQHGPPAEVNSRMYGTDVLPCVEDVNFQYKSRDSIRVQ